MTDMKQTTNSNRDPITGEPGSHPIGTGLGTAAGASAGVVGGFAAAAATGAALGSAVGPIGTAIGGAAGAIVGGLLGATAGKGLAEVVNPTDEDAYWSENFLSRPYAKDQAFDTYRPAFRHGYEAYAQYPERRFDDVESDVRQSWESSGNASLSWDQARPAVRDSFDRTGQVYSERTGKTPLLKSA